MIHQEESGLLGGEDNKRVSHLLDNNRWEVDLLILYLLLSSHAQSRGVALIHGYNRVIEWISHKRDEEVFLDLRCVPYLLSPH